MEAEPVRDLPEGVEWQYEPKWDGFRGLLENASGELRFGRATHGRYCATSSCDHWRRSSPLSALDGEIVIERGASSTSTRCNAPAPGREPCSEAVGGDPARFIAFDVFLERRRGLAGAAFETPSEVERAPSASSSHPRRATARRLEWLERFEAIGLDGVIAKRRDYTYPGLRDGVVKVKPEKTADCVVVGVREVRPIESRRCSSASIARTARSTMSARPRSPRRGTPISGACSRLENAPERRFSEPNRWGGGELEESPVRPEVVVEVRYDKVQSNRFRHGNARPLQDDKDPAQCTWRELRPPPCEASPSRRCSSSQHEWGVVVSPR